VVQLLNAFIYIGPYGKHFCMVFEILGVNLLELIKKYEYKGCPIHLCRKIAKQCLIGLDYLHNICKIIHTDLKPENVLMTLTPTQINEIVELGQLKRNPELEGKVKILKEKYGFKSITEIINECKPSWTAAAGGTANPLRKGDESSTRMETESTQRSSATLKNGYKLPSGEFDAQVIFQEEIKAHGDNMNKRDKKNLMKKLKRKEKKQNKGKKNTRKNTEDDGKSSDEEKEEMVEEKPKQAAPAPAPVIEKEEPGLVNDDDDRDSDPEVANFRLKIADLGNACWTHHHFQPEIQTRQYRSPEVILGISYNETADIWSFACMIFEMMQGDFLFAPRRQEAWSKSDDHLSLVVLG